MYIDSESYFAVNIDGRRGIVVNELVVDLRHQNGNHAARAFP